jgi:hypothetical protein
MSGLPEYNFPQFFFWEKYWQKRGFKVINPARKFFGYTGFPWWFYIICDIAILHFANITHIFMLQGWKQSTGAQIEILVAKKLNAKILYEVPPS